MGNCLVKSLEEQKNAYSHQLSNASLAKPQRAWQKCLKIDEVIIEKEYYEYKAIQHPVFQQIAKDKDRTYPQQQFFAFADNQNRFEALLRRVAVYFPKLGYTQGINFIAGQFLLYGMTDEEAYQSLIRIFTHPRLMLIGIYEDEFPLAKLYCQLFWKLIKRQMPKIVQQIQSLCIPDQMWVFQWFLSFFILAFPKEYIRDILYFIFCEKDFGLVKIAVAVMKILKDTLKTFQEGFQDKFMFCVEHLKDIGYASIVLPLSKLIEKASKIKTQDIQKELATFSCKNWYKQYFIKSESSRDQAYTHFLIQKDKERKQFLQAGKDILSSSNYQRMRFSVEVIDTIEEKKLERYRRRMGKSMGQKLTHRSLGPINLNRLLSDNQMKENNQTKLKEKPFGPTYVQSMFL